MLSLNYTKKVIKIHFAHSILKIVFSKYNSMKFFKLK